MERLRNSGSFRIVKGALILGIAAVLLYYLYDYLFNTTEVLKKADLLPESPTVSPVAPTLVYPTDPTVKLNQYIYTGGEMSVSFWMYVTGIQSMDNLSKKHILHLGTSEADESPTLSISFGPGFSNGLYVRVKTMKTTSNFSLFMGPGGESNNDLSTPCNISNIEFGRWVNVVVVLNNNLCDVYMDGKLSRSCVLDSQFQVNSSAPLFFFLLKPSFSATINSQWNGSLSNAVFYNYAISPDVIYRIYMAGPVGSSGDMASAIKSFFGVAKTYLPAVTMPTITLPNVSVTVTPPHVAGAS